MLETTNQVSNKRRETREWYEEACEEDEMDGKCLEERLGAKREEKRRRAVSCLDEG